MACLGHDDLVGEGHLAAPRFLNPGSNRDQVTVAGGGQVAGLYFDDGQVMALGFHVSIASALLVHVFTSPHLEPDDVVGVVDDAHSIGLGIANPQCRLYYSAFAHADVLVIPSNAFPSLLMPSSILSGPAVAKVSRKVFLSPSLG